MTKNVAFEGIKTDKICTGTGGLGYEALCAETSSPQRRALQCLDGRPSAATHRGLTEINMSLSAATGTTGLTHWNRMTSGAV